MVRSPDGEFGPGVGKATPGCLVYTDGSCRQDRNIARPCAGYAVDAIDILGQVHDVVFGALPAEFPQTAAAAEAWAAVRAVELYEGTVSLAIENAAVVASSASPDAASGPSRLMGGAYLRVSAHIRAGNAVARKFPGHIEPDRCLRGSPSWNDARQQ